MKLRVRDAFTVANAVSLTGLWLTHEACRDLSQPRNIGKLLVARGLDLADGPLARAMNQQSDFGAGIDATFDKIALAMIMKALWQQDLAPKPAIVAVGARNLLNTAATVGSMAKDFDGQELHRTDEGGTAIAIETAALGTFAIESIIRQQGHDGRLPDTLHLAAWAGIGIGTGVYGAKATMDYWERFITNDPQIADQTLRHLDDVTEAYLAAS